MNTKDKLVKILLAQDTLNRYKEFPMHLSRGAVFTLAIPKLHGDGRLHYYNFCNVEVVQTEIDGIKNVKVMIAKVTENQKVNLSDILYGVESVNAKISVSSLSYAFDVSVSPIAAYENNSSIDDTEDELDITEQAYKYINKKL